MFRSLPRRTFLRGLGAAIALPALDAMQPAFAAAKKAPCRMAFVYVPNGIVMEAWTPQTAAAAAPLPAALPRIAAPLAPYRDDILMLTGLTCNNGRALGDGPGDHGRAGASYLTAAHPKKTYGKDLRAGVSVDQMAALRLGSQTRLASLELGCEEGIQGGNCDNGYSCAYNNSISWRTPSSPMPPEVRPRAVFERLFGADGDLDPARRAREEKYRRSVLDLVLEDARSLRTTLGATDQRKLDEYLFSVRDIEKRIQQHEGSPARPPAGFSKPPSGVPDNFIEHVRLMCDLATVAFQTDSTRVVTLMFALEASGRAYREIGITDGHHGLTHHMGDAEKIEKVTRINRFHVEQYAYLLGRLKDSKDGDGTLLDHAMVVYGSGISDGNRHDHHNLPVVLAGRGCGGVRTGRHLRYPDETPMANLFVSMLDRMGVPAETLGDSSGPLQDLSVS